MQFKCKILSLLVCFLVLLSPFQFSVFADNVVNYKFNFGEGVETYYQKIEVACEYFGCNSDQLIRVMNCESTNNPLAINRREPGQPSGLFQYKLKTWSNFSQKAGIPNANIWDADAQIYTTAWAFSNNLSSHWACK